MKEITINTLFAGVGMQEKGIEHSILFRPKVVSVSEIDKEAIVSYAAIHCGLTPELVNNYSDYPSNDEMAEYLTKINLGYNPEKNKCYDWYKLSRKRSGEIRKYWLACKLANNLGDINKIEFLSHADLWTCSFPCTDISVAGQMKGLSPDSGTRSSLLWENIRLLKLAKENGNLPKYILVENVKNLVSKKYINDFNNLLEVLDELGFNSYYKVLNAKDCGVPQNRERVFVISIRKDIDTGKFEFPKPFDTGIRLKDVLDKDVDEKYYLSDDIYKNYHAINDTNNCIQVGNLTGSKWDKMHDLCKRYYSPEGVSPTLNTCNGGNHEAKIIEPINAEPDGTCRTIKAQYANTSKANFKYSGTYGATGVSCNGRIRKLTPNECYKLMGLTTEDFNKAKAMGTSDSQLYKQAGNGLVTNCVQLIFEHLYKAQYDNTYVCTDENFQIVPTK